MDGKREVNTVITLSMNEEEAKHLFVLLHSIYTNNRDKENKTRKDTVRILKHLLSLEIVL